MSPALLDRPAPAVTPSADPDTLVIVVRQEHIDRGEPQDSSGCAIALAAREATGSIVSMGRATLHIGCKTWLGGEDVREFTDAFDYGKRVYPDRFTFRRAGQW